MLRSFLINLLYDLIASAREGAMQSENKFEQTSIHDQGINYTVNIKKGSEAGKTDPKAMMCLDWDNTMVDGHMHSKLRGLSYQDAGITTNDIKAVFGKDDHDIKDILRNPEALKKNIGEALDNGLGVTIISHSSFPNAINETIKEAFPNFADKMTIITASPRKDSDGTMVLLNKALLMDKACEINNISAENKENVVLIDDAMNNIKNVREAGYGVIHAKKGDNQYLNEMDTQLANIIERTKEMGQDRSNEPIYGNINSGISPSAPPLSEQPPSYEEAIAGEQSPALHNIRPSSYEYEYDRQQPERSQDKQERNAKKKETKPQEQGKGKEGNGILSAIAKVVDMVLAAFGIPPIATIAAKIMSALGFYLLSKRKRKVVMMRGRSSQKEVMGKLNNRVVANSIIGRERLISRLYL